MLRGFSAFDLFLEQHPEFRERVTFIAQLMPSRTDVAEYAEYLERIEALVAVVNHRHGTPDWMPIQLKLRDDLEEAVAAYKHYDVLLVNAMFDGMNLVAKEGPLVNERDGVSILSENTGAHEELGEFALCVNPFDIQETADSIHAALTMPQAERARRAQGLKETVTPRDPGDWIDEQLADIRKKAGGALAADAELGGGDLSVVGRRGGAGGGAGGRGPRCGRGRGMRRRPSAGAGRGCGRRRGVARRAAWRVRLPRPRAALAWPAARPCARVTRAATAARSGPPGGASDRRAAPDGTAGGGALQARPGDHERRRAPTSGQPGHVAPADPALQRAAVHSCSSRARPRSPRSFAIVLRRSSEPFSCLPRTPSTTSSSCSTRAPTTRAAPRSSRRSRTRSRPAARSSTRRTGARARCRFEIDKKKDADYHLLQFHGDARAARAARPQPADHRRGRPLPDHQARAGHARPPEQRAEPRAGADEFAAEDVPPAAEADEEPAYEAAAVSATGDSDDDA